MAWMRGLQDDNIAEDKRLIQRTGCCLLDGCRLPRAARGGGGTEAKLVEVMTVKHGIAAISLMDGDA
jgi:hypothetical protein